MYGQGEPCINKHGYILNQKDNTTKYKIKRITCIDKKNKRFPEQKSSLLTITIWIKFRVSHRINILFYLQISFKYVKTL